METIKVFVASSTEGLPIAKVLQTKLQQELGDGAEVILWRERFPVSSTTIESLESVAEEIDFAVILVTGDDVTFSREVKAVSPRDNIVFEMGLFIGALRRKHTFIVSDESQLPKFPSDLNGVTFLLYDSTTQPTQGVNFPLEKCRELAKQIMSRPSRVKLRAEDIEEQAENCEFVCALEGMWWEKINYPQGSSLSCFTITPSTPPGSLIINGSGYKADGTLAAYWKSEMVRLFSDDRRLSYLWRGWHPLPECAHLKFHGFGTVEFDQPDTPAAQLSHGCGEFWDVDEARPRETVCKPVEIRRVADVEHIEIMNGRSTDEKRELVREVLDAW